MTHLSTLARQWRGVAVATALACTAAAAQAALQSRDYNLDTVVDGYYDTTLDITWWAQANAAAGSAQDDGFITNDGLMSWANANTWVAGFSPFGTTGWRLATIDPACSGYGCNSTAGELGYMFYANLGGTAGASIGSLHGPAYAGFGGISEGLYWSSNTYADDPEQASVLDFSDGNRNNDFKVDPVGAVWAVAKGDVLATVPEPSTMLLVTIGMGMCLLKSRRR
jgi:hypothetical protein